MLRALGIAGPAALIGCTESVTRGLAALTPAV
jgi:hypothetical protein